MPSAVARRTALRFADLRRSRCGPLQKQARRHQRHHTGASGHGARAGHPFARPREQSRGSLGAHALAGRQAQPDIGLHLGSQPVPGNRRQFVQSRPVLRWPTRRSALPCGTRGNAPRDVPCAGGRTIPVLAGVKRQNRLTWMRHGFLFSMYRRNLMRALAMCDRTVALEQFSLRATSSAGKPSTSRSISAARSRAVSRRKPSSR